MDIRFRERLSYPFRKHLKEGLVEPHFNQVLEDFGKTAPGSEEWKAMREKAMAASCAFAANVMRMVEKDIVTFFAGLSYMADPHRNKDLIEEPFFSGNHFTPLEYDAKDGTGWGVSIGIHRECT